jgi:hypothetical protein
LLERLLSLSLFCHKKNSVPLLGECSIQGKNLDEEAGPIPGTNPSLPCILQSFQSHEK